MSFAWQEFRELAIWLLKARTDEASQRTAMSRAYYAAYHAASVFVRAHDLCPPTQQLTHERVWRLIRESGRPNCTDIAKLGSDLKRTRASADYRNPFPGNLVHEASDAIADSATIIALLREM